MADGKAFRWMGESVLIEIKPNSIGCPRLGITATKRYGKAHVRNRFKRLVREAFRVLDWADFASLDILVKPKKMVFPASMDRIQEDLLMAKKRLLAISKYTHPS